MFKGIFESPISLSIGIIMRSKVHKNGAIKYEILYKDQSGREHTRWSDWMRFDGYQIGDSIPVKIITIPATGGLFSDLLEVNGHPQDRVEPYVLAMVLTGAAALFVGYHIGKDKK